MKAVWIDAGNDPAYAKLANNGITWPYFDIREQRLSPAYLDAVRGHPGIDGCGVYAAWNWFPDIQGYAFAEYLNGRLLQIGWPGNAPVCADIETHSVDYILGFLKRWRELRPKRLTYWTLEGYQGGLFNAEARLKIAASKVSVVPQAYAGDMTPFDAVDVVHDLWEHGFAPAGVTVFYDAARLPAAWSGFAFTQGRLP